MTASTGGDFERRSDPYRHELMAHCYRLLGSTHEAETLLWTALNRAWHAYARFDDRRAAMRTWLYGIATTACLQTLTGRRYLPSGLAGPSGDPDQIPVRGDDVRWLQPFPDATPRGDLRLAFVAALQRLPPHQRAVLLLRDIAGLSTDEVADILDSNVGAVNSTRRRARARLAELAPAADPPAADPTVLDRYRTAFEHADISALSQLVTDDVVLELPPYRDWFVGRENHRRRLSHLLTTDQRVIPTAANGQPAIATYARGAPDGEYRAHAIAVFTVAGNGISHIVICQDPTLFAPFGLPPGCSAQQAQVS